MHLTQSFILAQGVLKSYIFLKQMEILPRGGDNSIFFKDFLESRGCFLATTCRAALYYFKEVPLLLSLFFSNLKNAPESEVFF